MVGRPRKFDPERVLDSAMQVFWSKGYEATSMSDLMSATGLHKGSIYQAFGDKHSLFIQALNRYLADMRRQKNLILGQADSPLDGLRQAAHAIIDFADDSECPRGCMAVNALAELAPHDPVVNEILLRHLEGMRDSIIGAIEQAIEAGETATRQSPQVLAAIITTFMGGIATSIKGPMSKAQAHTLMDTLLDSLF